MDSAIDDVDNILSTVFGNDDRVRFLIILRGLIGSRASLFEMCTTTRSLCRRVYESLYPQSIDPDYTALTLYLWVVMLRGHIVNINKFASNTTYLVDTVPFTANSVNNVLATLYKLRSNPVVNLSNIFRAIGDKQTWKQKYDFINAIYNEEGAESSVVIKEMLAALASIMGRRREELVELRRKLHASRNLVDNSENTTNDLR